MLLGVAPVLDPQRGDRPPRGGPWRCRRSPARRRPPWPSSDRRRRPSSTSSPADRARSGQRPGADGDDHVGGLDGPAQVGEHRVRRRRGARSTPTSRAAEDATPAVDEPPFDELADLLTESILLRAASALTIVTSTPRPAQPGGDLAADEPDPMTATGPVGVDPASSRSVSAARPDRQRATGRRRRAPAASRRDPVARTHASPPDRVE